MGVSLTGSLTAALPELTSTLAELVFPQRCVACHSLCSGSRAALCWPCRGPLEQPARPVSGDPGSAGPAGMQPWAVAPYGGAVRAAIVSYKERGRWGLARPLGHALARAALAAHRGPGGGHAPGTSSESAGGELLLVPVPARPSSVRRRGHDPLAVLARVAVRALRDRGQPARSLALLRHVRAVADQSQLGAAERAANMAGALAVSPASEPRLRGRTVILVDDVLTSGATLAEAGRALRAAGARAPGAGLIAATGRSQAWP